MLESVYLARGVDSCWLEVSMTGLPCSTHPAAVHQGTVVMMRGEVFALEQQEVLLSKL